MLPRWLEIMGPASWPSARGDGRPVGRHRSAKLLRQQAATFSMAVLCELDRDRPDRDYLRQRVRESLVGWQASLRSDGLPLQRRMRSDLYHGVTLFYVLQTLTETVGFQTPMLLGDIERHVRWIARGNTGTAWLEATTICALTDCSALVRDTRPLHTARVRLSLLLATQNEEGWFADAGGVDVGRLSLTIDALARIRRNHHWPELDEPIEKALQFITHFVHPDGSTGGCYNNYNTTFISPAGVECLAPEFADASLLALHMRRQFDGDLISDRLDVGTCAVLGAGVSAARIEAGNLPNADRELPCTQTGTTRFPEAGLIIVSNAAFHAVISERKAGAIHVSWRKGIPLDDPGVGVIGLRSVTRSGRFDGRTRSMFAPDDEDSPQVIMRCTGILRRSENLPISWRDRIKRMVRRLTKRLEFGRVTAGQQIDPRVEQLLISYAGAPITANDETRRDERTPPDSRRPRMDWRRLTHDYFQREIRVADQTIQILDRIACRIGCHTLVLQSLGDDGEALIAECTGASSHPRPALFVEFGRMVQVVRRYRDGLLVDAEGAPSARYNEV